YPCPIAERGAHLVHRGLHRVKETVIDGSTLAERLVQVHTSSTQLLYCWSKRRGRRLLHSRVVLQLIDLRGPRVQRVEHDGTSPCARLDAEHLGAAADRIAISHRQPDVERDLPTTAVPRLHRSLGRPCPLRSTTTGVHLGVVVLLR